MKKTHITYASSGVNYNNVDGVKRTAQRLAHQTAKNLRTSGMTEVSQSRGESAFVWDEGESFRAFVVEGLGTKSGVADEVRKITGKTYYDILAHDTIATIINDLIVVGATPLVVNAYFAVESYDWFLDKKRSQELLGGWKSACDIAGVTWGGGETGALKTIIKPGVIDLAGSAVGIIKPKTRLTLGDKITAGDAILFIESSGIHTNGISLARAIAQKLSQGYATKLPDGTLFGEAILRPSHIYAKLIEDYFTAGIDIHYMVHMTGHGWRKLMRANRTFSYVIDHTPDPHPIFHFLQKHSGSSDKEMYANFNMSAGFAVFLPEHSVARAQQIATKYKLKSLLGGFVTRGPRRVVLSKKHIVYDRDTLGVR